MPAAAAPTPQRPQLPPTQAEVVAAPPTTTTATNTILPNKPASPNSTPRIEQSLTLAASSKMANTSAPHPQPSTSTSASNPPSSVVDSAAATKGGAVPTINTNTSIAKGAQPPAVVKEGDSDTTATNSHQTTQEEPQEPASPTHTSANINRVPSVGLTPQQYAGGYHPYMAYQEPPSPAGMGTTLYDASSLAGFHSLRTVGSYGGDSTGNQRQPPGSPSQNSAGIPPASPLFPRITTAATNGLLEHAIQTGMAPLSPGPPYLSPMFGPSSGGMYLSTTYARHHPHTQHSFQQQQQQQQNQVQQGTQPDGSQDEYASGWNDAQRTQLGGTTSQFSPQISSQGIPMPYVPAMPGASMSGRTASFDEMLPGPVIPTDQKSQGTATTQQTMSSADTANPMYSPYGSTSLVGPHGSATGGSAPGSSMFAHAPAPGQGWGYGSAVPEMFTPPSPLQPRATSMHHYGSVPPMPRIPSTHPTNMSHHQHPHHGHGGQYMGGQYGSGGQFYQSTSPGPPIQRSASNNKGPDGANLFIFHIPNNFSNVDMYNLFAPFGNLLSVRIMVERDTGRSRGFGFVSYDNPESAAIAIRELNQYPIGNKRLKVQHKMIKNDRDHHSHHDNHHAQQQQPQQQQQQQHGGGVPEGYVAGAERMHSLPPLGAGSSSNWQNQYPGQQQKSVVDGGVGGVDPTVAGLPVDATTAGGPVSVNMPTLDGADHNNIVDGGANPPPPDLASPLTTMDPLRAALPETN